MRPVTDRQAQTHAQGQGTWLGSLRLPELQQRARNRSRSSSTIPLRAISAKSSDRTVDVGLVWVAMTEVRNIGRGTAGGSEQLV